MEWGVCCVCRWPIYTDMQSDYRGRQVFVVGWQESESHPWCAPYRKGAGIEDYSYNTDRKNTWNTNG